MCMFVWNKQNCKQKKHIEKHKEKTLLSFDSCMLAVLLFLTWLWCSYYHFSLFTPEPFLCCPHFFLVTHLLERSWSVHWYKCNCDLLSDCFSSIINELLWSFAIIITYKKILLARTFGGLISEKLLHYHILYFT